MWTGLLTAPLLFASCGERAWPSWDMARHPIRVDTLQLPRFPRRPHVNGVSAASRVYGPLCAQDHFVLNAPLVEARRNHDCTIESDRYLINILGRNGRHVERRDLQTGATELFAVPGHDPAAHPLNDLNHIYGVRVQPLGDVASNSSFDAKSELWMVCGFHGDRINGEISSSYARVLDLRTMRVRLGPKLLRAGGACSALALEIDGPGTPEHICAFGGTDGAHNTGTFLKSVACYDRRRQVWHEPLGELPVACDHSNAILLPPSLCHPADPARVLLMNFRIRHYADERPEIWAIDLPVSATPRWYLFANETGTAEYLQPRDAAGVFTTASGRYVFNVGGVSYVMRDMPNGKRRRLSMKHSTVRVFDACARRWAPAGGDVGYGYFALQSCASSKLGLAFTLSLIHI